MPAQVPMEARKSEKGAGAESSPPATRGWSVARWWFPTCASTRLPPGKVTRISSTGGLLARLLGLRAPGATGLPAPQQSGSDERGRGDDADRTHRAEEHAARRPPRPDAEAQ